MSIRSTFTLPRLGSALAVAACVFVAGCHTQNQEQEHRPPAEVVKERATERWDALMAPNIAKAYSFLAPSVRAVMSQDGFRRRLNLPEEVTEAPWKSFKIESVTCKQPDICEVSVFVQTPVIAPGFTGMTASADLTERWVLEDGQWWLYMK